MQVPLPDQPEGSTGGQRPTGMNHGPGLTGAPDPRTTAGRNRRQDQRLTWQTLPRVAFLDRCMNLRSGNRDGESTHNGGPPRRQMLAAASDMVNPAMGHLLNASVIKAPPG